MSQFVRNGYEIHYEVFRNCVPEHTLLIHGNLGSNRWWQPAVGQWEGRAPDSTGLLILAEWRGCGQTSKPETLEDLSIAAMAQDYLELLKELQIPQAHLVGHSTGGLIALQMMLLEPERIRSSVLLDPVPDEGMENSADLRSTLEQMSKDSEFCTAVIGQIIHKKNFVNPEFVRALGKDAFQVDALIWRGIPHVLAHTDLSAESGKIRQSIQIIHGAQDAIIPVQSSLGLVERLPRARLKILDGVGHCLNVEDPKLFVDLCCEFLFS